LNRSGHTGAIELTCIHPSIHIHPSTQVHGVFWGSYMTKQPSTLRASMDQVLSWAALGQLRIPVSHRFGLEGVPEAMGVLLGRGVTGKVLIVPQQGGGGVRSRL